MEWVSRYQLMPDEPERPHGQIVGDVVTVLPKALLWEMPGHHLGLLPWQKHPSNRNHSHGGLVM